MKAFLEFTAWPMTAPAPYSVFHIVFCVVGILGAGILAWTVKRKSGPAGAIRLLFICGVVLAVSEGYKQLFLYYIVNGQIYDWWYFPFQLCSLPMYFCLALPFLPPRRGGTVLCTFMQDFNFLGGVLALAEPSGLMHPYWTLTFHGLLWHIILIFIGLLTGLLGLSDLSVKGYLKTLPLLAVCIWIAEWINCFSRPMGQADMFYISPYHPSNQILFHEISLKLGIFPGHALYLLAICLGGFLVHMAFARFCAK